jgi:hypothetical protein
MIWKPKPGQRVRLVYANKSMPYNGAYGVVKISANGKGPINALVELPDGNLVVVPRGQLTILREPG